MKVFQKSFQTSYEELITYYPRYYRDVFEMDAILRAFGQIADTLEEGAKQAFLNNFIAEADERTISIWEGILNIIRSEQLTLDQRKRTVIARIIGKGHIGEPEIREIIANYTDRSVEVDFAHGVIYVSIGGEVFDESNLAKTILQAIPAHLALRMTIHIRRQYRCTAVFSYAGGIGSRLTAPPLPVKYASRKKSAQKGGAFTRTRVRSRLIAQD